MTDTALIAEAQKLVGEFDLDTPYTSAGAVASALITASGALYTGICLDLLCGVGFCAEHAAVAAMLQARETEIAKIVAVSADGILPPCGRCRELLAQVNHRNLDCLVLLGDEQPVPLRTLLPHWWVQ